MPDPKNKNDQSPIDKKGLKPDAQAFNPKDDKGLKPDPETLHTTDPQEHMKGPISSSVQTVKEEVEKGDNETKQEADKKRDENL